MDFLIDKSERYTYEDLLNIVNNADRYIPFFKEKSLYHFFCNLIVGLVSNQPLVLLDSDIKLTELEEGVESKINKSKLISKHYFSTMADLINAIHDSRSEITIFTSGTTGQPKKVIHSVMTLTRTVRIAERYKDKIWAFAYNPTHMAGLQVFFQALSNCNTLINVFNASRTDIYNAIKEWRITHISATPTFYRLLLPVESSYVSVERVTLGGEKSDNHLYLSIKQIFPSAKINNIYASTEAGSLFAAKGEYFQLSIDLCDRVKVVDDELLLHKSLLGKSDDFSFSDGYYHTGDIIEWINQEERLFKFKSRKNELINVGGYKVNPGEVENVILRMNGIQQALVYGQTNSVLGNILCAEIKIEPNVNLTELEIRQYLSGMLQDFKIPRKIKFVESFSMTRSGKLKRS